MGSERRRHTRYTSKFPVTFTNEKVTGEGTAINVSREGCLIESDTQVEQDAYLAMTIHFPQLLMPLEVELAAVRWIEGRVFGVEFRYMHPEQHESLEKLITALKVQPAT